MLSRARNKHLDETLERCGIVVGNCTLRTHIVLVGAKSALRHYNCTSDFVIAVEEPKLGEIAGPPAAQLLETLKLSSIVVAPTRRIG